MYVVTATWYPLALLLLAATSSDVQGISCMEDGAVRLVDGNVNVIEGRLEICINGEWGTVCNDGLTDNDGFDIDAARVVCQQLLEQECVSSQTVITNILFGGASSRRPIYLDDVQCTGTEPSLLNCSHSGIGVHNCGNNHEEDVGIICERSNECMDGTTRLVDGDNYNATEGRVEYCVGGRWGTVCNYLWSEADATVVCRQLELNTFVTDVKVLTEVPQVKNLMTPIVLDALNCRGTETNLDQCEHAPVVEYCTHSQDAGARCTMFKECNDGDLRLVQLDGDMEYEGRVELCASGRWGIVCYDFWDRNDAKVVCRQLGFSVESTSSALPTDTYIGRNPQPVLLNKVDCIGAEDNIAQCPQDSSYVCLNPGAGVSCTAPGCARPSPPMNGSVYQLERQFAPAMFNITYKCNQGYTPTDLFIATCLYNRRWSQYPADLLCMEIDECSETSTCPDGSQCINTDGSYTCSCDIGFFHLRNEIENKCIDVDECIYGTHTCDDNAYCTNLEGTFSCSCKPGYIGNGTSCLHLDEVTCSKACSQHCIHNENGVKCACNRGYYLASDGVTCMDINECITTNHNCNHAKCRNTFGSFECVCNPGFKSNSENGCIDIDECSTGSHSCDENADCNNTVGSFSCTCRSSYFGDGKTCFKGIAPEISHTLTTDKPNHNLQYSVGDSFCIEDVAVAKFHSVIMCPLVREPLPLPRFKWKLALNEIELNFSNINQYGLSVWINRSILDNDTLSLNGTLVVGLDQNSTLYVTCDVSNTFGNDTDVTSIRLCILTECQDGVTNNCTQECTRDILSGEHNCSCRSGFRISDTSDSMCEDINECILGAHNCSSVNRQECVNMPPGSFTCQCISGFSGDDCQDINECDCDFDVCPSSSLCMNTYGSYECVCVNGTRMHNNICVDIDECLENTHNCSMNARCENVQGTYYCRCLVGFEGDGETCTLSTGVIAGTSVVAAFIAVITLLIVVICAGIKIKLRFTIQDIPPRSHEMELISGIRDSETSSLTGIQHVPISGSQTIALPPFFNIKSANLKMMDVIGQGEFGVVYKGYLSGQYMDEMVAIKTLKGFIDDGAVQDLLSECIKMKSFDHPHVMTLKGVCLDGGPVPYIILPYMANGSLLSYLKRERPNLIEVKETSDFITDLQTSQIFLIRKRLMDMCLQVAKGMEYLAEERLIHRDLAARNCMIDINMVIKVADFGLSVKTGTKDYFRLTDSVSTRLPVMWMAPESLTDYIFSEMTDVWSYGVTCWEIFTGGQAPYAGIKPQTLLSLLQEGERLLIPTNLACNSKIYSVMMWCWEMDPSKRPSFSTLVQTISESLEEMTDYLHIGAFTEFDPSSGQAEDKL